MNTDYNCKMNYLKKRHIQVQPSEKYEPIKSEIIKKKKEILEDGDLLFFNYFLAVIFILFFFSLIKWNV